MSDIEKLSFDERVFLAGSIKTMILADGNISGSELTDIDDLQKMEGFDDFDKCLEEFENKVTSNEEYWKYAESITNEKTREIIMKYLDEVSLKDGFPDASERNLFNKLVNLWK